jgi:hypothetical protein
MMQCRTSLWHQVFVKLVATPLGWLREAETLFAEARSRDGSWGVRIGRTMWFSS